jgi:DNA-binding beta-propeller fold protein YncE
MKTRRALLAAASTLGLLVGSVPAPAIAADKPPLDANGVPCVNGKLDGALQCIPNALAKGSADRPYREAGVSDPRLAAAHRLGTGFQTTAKRLVYAAVPGSVLIFDAHGDFNDKYTFIKRITFEDAPAPIGPESISAMMADPATNMIYVSTRGTLYAIDLLTEKVVWKNRYQEGTCCERGAVTPDGRTLIVGSDLKNFHYVLDARTGAVEGKIPTPMSMFNHNMNLSADGKTDFAAANGITMTIADVPSRKPIKTITFDDHVRVFVINHDATKVYANLNNLLGFEIADVKSGKVVERVEAPAEMWKAKWADPNATFYGHGAPMHGIAMLPDESEIWIPDAINNQVLVYDNDGATPRLNMTKSFKTNGQPNGWITFGLDGKLAYMASGDVVDTATHKIIAQLKDEYGRYFNSEKMLEMEFDRNGHLVRTVNQFSNGLPEAYAERHPDTAGRRAGS